METITPSVVEFEEDDVVMVAPHQYACLDGKWRKGAGGRYRVVFKFRNGTFFGEPLDVWGVGYAHVVPIETIRWRMNE